MSYFVDTYVALKRVTNKPIEVLNELDKRQFKAVQDWISAFEELKRLKAPWNIFESETKFVEIGLPQGTEDAHWKPGKILFLATEGAGYNTRHMLCGLVHELGHALEEKLGIGQDIVAGKTIWGKPPYANNYCAVNGYEDFAESFMLYVLQNDLLKRSAADKHEYLDRVIRPVLQYKEDEETSMKKSTAAIESVVHGSSVSDVLEVVTDTKVGQRMVTQRMQDMANFSAMAIISMFDVPAGAEVVKLGPNMVHIRGKKSNKSSLLIDSLLDLDPKLQPSIPKAQAAVQFPIQAAKADKGMLSTIKKVFGRHQKSSTPGYYVAEKFLSMDELKRHKNDIKKILAWIIERG